MHLHKLLFFLYLAACPQAFAALAPEEKLRYHINAHYSSLDLAKVYQQVYIEFSYAGVDYASLNPAQDECHLKMCALIEDLQQCMLHIYTSSKSLDIYWQRYPYNVLYNYLVCTGEHFKDDKGECAKPFCHLDKSPQPLADVWFFDLGNGKLSIVLRLIVVSNNPQHIALQVYDAEGKACSNQASFTTLAQKFNDE